MKKKSKYLLISLLFTFNVEAVLALSCDINFYKSYQSKELEYKLLTLPEKKLESAFAKIKNLKSNKEKLDGLEEVYDYLFRYYQTKNQQLNLLVEAGQGKLPAEYLSQAKRQLEIDGMREITGYNNRLIDNLADLMRDSGIPVHIKMRKVIGDFEFKYLLLDANAPANTRSIKTIQRYQSRFGTKEVTFDLLQNTKNGSAGFSQQATRRIDLGMRGIRNIVVDDLITMVGKHEFYHAAFVNMRDKGVRSIYHPSYISTGTSPISTVPNHYNRYMSAEELYNWTNNSFWAAERMKDITKFTATDVINDFYGINSYLGGTLKIAQQTKEVATNFVKFAKNVQSKQIREGKFYLEILNFENKAAQSLEEAKNLAFIREDGVAMVFFVDERIQPTVTKVLERRISLTKEYDALFAKHKENPKKLAELTEEYLRKETAGMENELHDLMEVVAQDQITLARVADAVEAETRVVMAKSDALLKELEATKAAFEINPYLFGSAEWVDKFSDMAIEYRRFGNIVKENYKGFVGH